MKTFKLLAAIGMVFMGVILYLMLAAMVTGVLIYDNLHMLGITGWILFVLYHVGVAILAVAAYEETEA